MSVATQNKRGLTSKQREQSALLMRKITPTLSAMRFGGQLNAGDNDA